jgi:ribosomal protein S18 acetylase RimI-like enzyme
LNIRRATFNDIEKIKILEEQVHNLHLKARSDMIDENKDPFSYRYLNEAINSENIIVTVAEDKNEIIGCLTFAVKNFEENHYVFKEMEYIEIENLCVDKDSREKGVGKKLFETVIEYAKYKNINHIELDVWDFNQNAINFYEHLGMKARTHKMELIVANKQ